MFVVVSLSLWAAVAGAQTSGAAQSPVVAAVKQFVDGFNKGDVKAMSASCADQVSILDEFPPHEWHGTGACAKWAGDYDVDAKKNGITDGVVTLSTPTHVDVTADRAYVVVPADYRFKVKGKPTGEVGSIITLALVKGAGGWKITGWAWAKH
jgi:ketosteroid isomerase-like protein